MISSRVEEKSKEGSTVIAGGLEDEGAEVGLVDEKGGPVGGGFFGGEGKARAVSGGKVGECTGGASTAPWHSAETSRVTGPMSTEPIGSISTTEHTKLNSRFSHLIGIPMAGGEEGRGAGEGYMGDSHVRDGGEGGRLRLQLLVPEGYNCASGRGSPFPLSWRVGQDNKGVWEIVLHTDLTDLEEPQRR